MKKNKYGIDFEEEFEETLAELEAEGLTKAQIIEKAMSVYACAPADGQSRGQSEYDIDFEEEFGKTLSEIEAEGLARAQMIRRGLIGKR